MKRGIRVVWLAALLLVACTGTAPNILHVQAGPTGVVSKSSEINDGWLGRSLKFGDVMVRPLGLGASFEAQVTLQNQSPTDTYFEYKFLWYDASGFEVSSITNWTPAVLGGRESRGFMSTAPDMNAVSFKFMVRSQHTISPTGS